MADETSRIHEHPVVDDDPHFIISGDTKEITPATEDVPVLIRHDHNSEIITFEVPKVIDGHDMTQCTHVEVHYINVDKLNTQNTSASRYDVPLEDIQPKTDDPNTLAFTWLIDGAATKYIGPLNFAVRFRCVTDTEVTEPVTRDDNSTELVTVIKTVDSYRLNTKPFIGVNVEEGLDTQLAMSDEYADVIDQWQNAINAYGDSSVTKVKAEYNTAITNLTETVVNTVNNKIAEIDEHVAEVVKETRQELTASKLSADEIIVQSTGQATDRVMSQQATTNKLSGLAATIGTENAKTQALLTREITTLSGQVASLLSDDALKRYVLVHEYTAHYVEDDEGWYSDDGAYYATRGVKYAIAGNAPNNNTTDCRVAVTVGYNAKREISSVDTPYMKYKRVIIQASESAVMGAVDDPDNEGAVEAAYGDDALVQLHGEYDKYDYPPYKDKVNFIRFVDCYMTYYPVDDTTLVGPPPEWGIYVNVVYEVDDVRKTATIPVCKTSEYYDTLWDYTRDGQNANKIPTPPAIVGAPSYGLSVRIDANSDEQNLIDHQIYRVNEFINGDTVSFTVNANNIVSIDKTGTKTVSNVGIVDTYTIVFTNGDKKTFTVTNGRAIESVEKTATVNDEDIYTIRFNDGTTQTFAVPNVEANRSCIEDNVEDLHSILNQFGATTSEQVAGMAGVVDVPDRASKYAKLNSFGGMSRKVVVPTAQGNNLLPFPYAGNNFGTDGAGVSEHLPTGDFAGNCVYIDETNPWKPPYAGEYLFFVEATNIGTANLQVSYRSADESGAIHELCSLTDTDSLLQRRFDDGTKQFAFAITLEKNDTVINFSFQDDSGMSQPAWTCKPGIYAFPWADDDEGGRRDWTNYVPYLGEWQPRTAQYKFQNTKLEAIKSVGANLLNTPYDDTSFTANGLTFTVNGDGSLSMSGTSSNTTNFNFRSGESMILPAGTYTASIYGDVTTDNEIRLWLYKSSTAQQVAFISFPSKTTFTFTLAEETSFNVYVMVMGPSTVSGTMKIMINSGDTALPWEPYVEHVYAVPDSIQKLDGVGLGVDENYHSKVDVTTGTFTSLKTVVLDGSSNGRKVTNFNTSNNCHYASLSLPTHVKDATAVRFSHFNETISSVAARAPGNAYIAGTNNSVAVMFHHDQTIDSVEAWNNWLKRQHAAGTPVTIIYESTEPIEEPLPTRLDKLIPIEPSGHLIAVTNTGEEVPIDVEFTVIETSMGDVLDRIIAIQDSLIGGES